MTESHNSMKTGIPNRQKTAPKPAASCRIDYFGRVARPPCSTAWRFFTGDYGVCWRQDRHMTKIWNAGWAMRELGWA
jgi:hypothetical protein